jgi:hypothetical protein
MTDPGARIAALASPAMKNTMAAIDVEINSLIFFLGSLSAPE